MLQAMKNLIRNELGLKETGNVNNCVKQGMPKLEGL